MELTNSLIATAQKWWDSNPECQGGVVLIWDGKAYGWNDQLRDPEKEKPGAFAVDSGGTVFKALGDTECLGAQSWVKYPSK